MERQKTPTLINLPPPDPFTPSDLPGTPNSTQTSLSAISTTAIKDGHTGTHGASHRHHHHHHSSSNVSETSTNTLDAERADRISRLAGLERVSTVRQPSAHNAHLHAAAAASPAGAVYGSPASSSSALGAGPGAPPQTIGYFDATGNPRLANPRSTVGSASATGSVAGGTTWPNGSTTTGDNEMDEQEQEQEHDGRSMSHMSVQDTNMSAAGGDETDKMSDVDAVSSAGLSDGGRDSLVGFGEGAGSTVSGPISAPRDPAQMARLRAAARLGSDGSRMSGGMGGGGGLGGYAGQGNGIGGGLAQSPDGMDGVETAERIVRENLGSSEGGIQSPGDGSLGKFAFEER